MDLLCSQVETLVNEIHSLDLKYDWVIENLKKEMNFSSLIFMVNEKADNKYVKEIKYEIDQKIRDLKDLGSENEKKTRKLWTWTEKLTEVLAKVETIVKMNFPLAIQKVVMSDEKCLSCGVNKALLESSVVKKIK